MIISKHSAKTRRHSHARIFYIQTHIYIYIYKNEFSLSAFEVFKAKFCHSRVKTSNKSAVYL